MSRDVTGCLNESGREDTWDYLLDDWLFACHSIVKFMREAYLKPYFFQNEMPFRVNVEKKC